MAVEVRNDVTNFAFFRGKNALRKDSETIVQDAGRAADMLAKTVMSYDPATGKWTSFTDETATDGTQFPRGILLETIAQASIVAGDVTGVNILVGDAIVDENQVVIENSKTLATVINAPAGVNITVEESLRQYGIFMQNTFAVDGLENS